MSWLLNSIIIFLSMFILGCTDISPDCKAMDRKKGIYKIPSGLYEGHMFVPHTLSSSYGRMLGTVLHKDSVEVLQHRYSYPCQLFTNNP